MFKAGCTIAREWRRTPIITVTTAAKTISVPITTPVFAFISWTMILLKSSPSKIPDTVYTPLDHKNRRSEPFYSLASRISDHCSSCRTCFNKFKCEQSILNQSSFPITSIATLRWSSPDGSSFTTVIAFFVLHIQIQNH